MEIFYAMNLWCQGLIWFQRHIMPFYFQSPKQSAQCNGRCRVGTEPSFSSSTLWDYIDSWSKKVTVPTPNLGMTGFFFGDGRVFWSFNVQRVNGIMMISDKELTTFHKTNISRINHRSIDFGMIRYRYFFEPFEKALKIPKLTITVSLPYLLNIPSELFSITIGSTVRLASKK